jgi:hypothetical protein
MLDEMGGMQRYERQQEWWQASRARFARAMS